MSSEHVSLVFEARLPHSPHRMRAWMYACLHAHVPVAHVGPDINGEPMWDIKNEVCARPGENDPTKWGTGRFHMEVDPENNLHGHATQEELLVDQK